MNTGTYLYDIMNIYSPLVDEVSCVMTYNDDNNMVTASGQSEIFANTFTAAVTPGWMGWPRYSRISIQFQTVQCQWTQWVEILNILIGFGLHLVTIKLMPSHLRSPGQSSSGLSDSWSHSHPGGSGRLH